MSIDVWQIFVIAKTILLGGIIYARYCLTSGTNEYRCVSVLVSIMTIIYLHFTVDEFAKPTFAY